MFGSLHVGETIDGWGRVAVVRHVKVRRGGVKGLGWGEGHSDDS